MLLQLECKLHVGVLTNPDLSWELNQTERQIPRQDKTYESLTLTKLSSVCQKAPTSDHTKLLVNKSLSNIRQKYIYNLTEDYKPNGAFRSQSDGRPSGP